MKIRLTELRQIIREELENLAGGGDPVIEFKHYALTHSQLESGFEVAKDTLPNKFDMYSSVDEVLELPDTDRTKTLLFSIANRVSKGQTTLDQKSFSSGPSVYDKNRSAPGGLSSD